MCVGQEYPAIVEFAPFQRVPKRIGGGKRKDNLVGTIETEQAFLTFKENMLTEPQETPTNKQHYFETESNYSLFL